MKNEPFRLRYANQIVGAFLLFSLVGSTLLAVGLARNNRFLSKSVNFFASLTEQQAADLRTGTEVVVLGRNVGQVQSLDYLDNSDQVRLQLAIDTKYRDLITTGSVISLERKFGVGAMFIKVRRRSMSELKAEPVPLDANEFIPMVQDADRVDKMASEVTSASRSIDSIRESATPALESFRITSDTLNDSLLEKINPAAVESRQALRSLQATSDLLQVHSQQTTDNIQKLTDLMQAFVENDVRKGLESVTRASDSTANASDNLAKTSANLDKKTDLTNEDIRQTLATMRETLVVITKLSNESREFVQVLRGEAHDLPGTTAKFNDTVEDTQDLVQQIRSHWILRSTRNQANSAEPIKPSSIRAEGPR